MTTYADYSAVVIKRTVCFKCAVPIKGFSLQQLLDEEENLCASCKAQKPIKKYGIIES